MARQPAKPALLNRIQLKCGVPKAVDGNVKPTFRRDTDVQPAQIGLQGIKIVPRVGFRCAGRVGTIFPSYGILPNPRGTAIQQSTRLGCLFLDRWGTSDQPVCDA